jgi:hypothetical protein
MPTSAGLVEDLLSMPGLVFWCSDISGGSGAEQAGVLILPNAQKSATGPSDRAAGVRLFRHPKNANFQFP